MIQRIQRKRRPKGFKLPPRTLCISRPSKWSNPFQLLGDMIYFDAGYRRKILDKWVLFDSIPCRTENDVYHLFRDLLWNPDFYEIEPKIKPGIKAKFVWTPDFYNVESEIKARFVWMRKNIGLLNNYDYIACYCGLDKKCHGDALIEYFTCEK